MSFIHLCYIVSVCFHKCVSHIEELRYLRVIVGVLLLVVFLEFCSIVVSALLCRASASKGMLLGLSERRTDGTTEENERWDDNREK